MGSRPHAARRDRHQVIPVVRHSVLAGLIRSRITSHLVEVQTVIRGPPLYAVCVFCYL
jgi:hypothetical protein